MTLGIGYVIGSILANRVYGANTISPVQHDWNGFWLFPAALAAVAAIIFALTFRERKQAPGQSPG
jgi:sugar phosphate permease